MLNSCKLKIKRHSRIIADRLAIAGGGGLGGDGIIIDLYYADIEL